MNKIRKGDDVIVIAGRSKGLRGQVLRVLGEDRLIVENVNMVKRHTKPNPPHHQGGILEKEAPIHRSNVMLYNPQTSRGDRVGIKTLEDGTRVRFFKSTGEVVDV